MPLIRPEVIALMRRWHEALLGVGVLGFGAFLVSGSYGLLYYLGFLIGAIGLAVIWLGIQRGRFRRTDTGAGTGVVRVDEGQIIYMGPLTGGASALADLERLTLIRTLSPPHWRLDGPKNESLLIPVNAKGAEALFDAFTALPGLRTERMLAELHDAQDQAVVIWERHSLRPVDATLH